MKVRFRSSRETDLFNIFITFVLEMVCTSIYENNDTIRSTAMNVWFMNLHRALSQLAIGPVRMTHDVVDLELIN